MQNFFKQHRKNIIFGTLLLIALAILLLIDTGFEKKMYYNAENVPAKVLSVNNEQVVSMGMFKQGEQSAEVYIESGSHKGETVTAVNLLSGKMEQDKLFVTGEKAMLLLERDDDNAIRSAIMVDHHRIPGEIILIALFGLALVIFSGWKGVRTLLSFAFALLAIWKLIVPLSLKGYPPLLVALVIGNVITVTTIFLVSGLNRSSLAAILGSVASALITAGFAIVFANVLHIDGTTLPWAESLLYAGFPNLDLSGLFQAAVYLSCSGAILDLAVDICSALDEVVHHKPDITHAALFRSGIRIGRTVVGSQTTTLLLAYMGSYLSIMMVYMAQGTPMYNLFSTKAIGAEVLNTFVGCIGLVMVSPLSSLIFMLLNREGPADGAVDEEVSVAPQ